MAELKLPLLLCSYFKTLKVPPSNLKTVPFLNSVGLKKLAMI